MMSTGEYHMLIPWDGSELHVTRIAESCLCGRLNTMDQVLGSTEGILGRREMGQLECCDRREKCEEGELHGGVKVECMREKE
jgi:hypothetical protein